MSLNCSRARTSVDGCCGCLVPILPEFTTADDPRSTVFSPTLSVGGLRSATERSRQGRQVDSHFKRHFAFGSSRNRVGKRRDFLNDSPTEKGLLRGMKNVA